jgi:hypothetical protein
VGKGAQSRAARVREADRPRLGRDVLLPRRHGAGIARTGTAMERESTRWLVEALPSQG